MGEGHEYQRLLILGLCRGRRDDVIEGQTRGGGPGTWSILLAALGGLTLLLILDLWGFIQQQDSDKRTVSKRKSRKRRMKDSGQNFT